MSITNLPDEDHVMRYVPWTKLRRDEDDNVLGFLPEAFRLRPEEEGLSVNWLEYFRDPATRTRDSVWAMREAAMKVGTKSCFAVGNVGKIKEVCTVAGAKVRIIHVPKDNEPAHSEIRRLPADDLKLLAALADDAFVEMVRNADIPQKAAP